jgi:hypothetical protein
MASVNVTREFGEANVVRPEGKGSRSSVNAFTTEGTEDYRALLLIFTP